jgi:hypothetical protein
MSSTEPDPTSLEDRVARLESRLRTPITARPRERDWDAYAAVIASLVGLLALVVSGYTAHLQRRQLRATVWPSLSIYRSSFPPKFAMRNQGTGPARITAVRVTVDDRPVKNWSAFFCALDHFDPVAAVGSTAQGVLPSGDELVMVQSFGDDPASRRIFEDLIRSQTHTISITVCYCSVLEECSVAILGQRPASDARVPPDECPVTDESRFMD